MSATHLTSPMSDGRYIVHFLALKNDEKLLHFLKEYPSLQTVMSKQDGNRMVIHILASLGYKTLFLEFCKQFPQSINLLDGNQNHVLHYLIYYSDILEVFLKENLSKINVNTENNEYETPLSIAIVEGLKKSYSILLRYGANPNFLKKTSEPVLITLTNKPHEWFYEGKEHGLNIDRVGNDGINVLYLCYRQKKLDLLCFLVDKLKADLNVGGPFRKYIVFEIVRDADKKLFWWCLQRGMNLKVRNQRWSTPAHTYVLHNKKQLDVEMFCKLLQANVLEVDGDGKSLVDLLGPETVLTLPEKVIKLLAKAPQGSTVQTWSLASDQKQGAKAAQRLGWKSTSLSPPPSQFVLPVAKQSLVTNYHVYSAAVDHIVFFCLAILSQYSKVVYVNTTSRKLRDLLFLRFDSEASQRIKLRLTIIRRLSHRLNNFIEYHSPYVNWLPKLPSEFPTNKLSFFFLSIIGEVTNHSNLLIIDPLHQTVERFDPEGATGADMQQLDEWVKLVLIRSHPQLKKYNYLKAAGCNVFQLIDTSYHDERPGDPIGYCTAWCLWYLETRIKNWYWHPSHVWDQASKKLFNISSFREHIRNYSIALSERRNKIITRVLGVQSMNKSFFTLDEATQLRNYIDNRFLAFTSLDTL